MSTTQLTVPVSMPPIEQAQWYAVQTRPRHEKKIAAELQQKAVTAFLPLVKEVRHWSDRRTTVEFPLFSGYLFVSMLSTAQTRIAVLRSYGVLGFVGDRHQGTPIPENEIEQIRKLLAATAHFSSYPFLNIGQRVRIRGGALDGIEGILERRQGNDRLVISVEMIQRSLAISIEGYDVEPAGPAIHRA